jgi:hypothetical protein
MSVRRIDKHELGLTWVIEEPMTRTSHALVDQGRVWLIDPVDEPSAVDKATALGDPVAVVQLLDRHKRDCEAIAARLNIAHLALPQAVPDAPFEVVEVVRRRGWKEIALWWAERRALVVAEAVGTNPVFAAGPGPVGVHPLLRLLPPKALAAYRPDHLLVGHGPGLHGPATPDQLHSALARSRRDIPRALMRLPGAMRS